MTAKTKLLPCPFCGKDPKIDEPVIRDRTAWAYIRCDSYCGVKPHTSGSGDTHYYDKPWLEEGKYVEYRSQDEAKAFAMNLAMERWNTRAVPAEDVRTVGDEPVAWTSANTIGFLDKRRNESQTAWRLNLSAHPLETNDIPLYRHPQRPVVLPERAWDYSTYNYHELFNAIAEAVRLGPNSSISISVKAFEEAMIKLNS